MSADATDVIILACMTIQHSAFGTMRIVNDTQDLVRSAGTFAACPFSVILPPDDGETEPLLELTMPNVSLEVVELARKAAGSRDVPIIDLELVAHDDPDTVLMSYFGNEAREFTYDEASISFRFGPSSFLEEPYPAMTFSPNRFPAVFA